MDLHLHIRPLFTVFSINPFKKTFLWCNFVLFDKCNGSSGDVVKNLSDKNLFECLSRVLIVSALVRKCLSVKKMSILSKFLVTY